MEGNFISIDKISFNYNPDFENLIEKIADNQFSGTKLWLIFSEPQNTF